MAGFARSEIGRGRGGRGRGNPTAFGSFGADPTEQFGNQFAPGRDHSAPPVQGVATRQYQSDRRAAGDRFQPVGNQFAPAVRRLCNFCDADLGLAVPGDLRQHTCAPCAAVAEESARMAVRAERSYSPGRTRNRPTAEAVRFLTEVSRRAQADRSTGDQLWAEAPPSYEAAIGAGVTTYVEEPSANRSASVNPPGGEDSAAADWRMARWLGLIRQENKHMLEAMNARLDRQDANHQRALEEFRQEIRHENRQLFGEVRAEIRAISAQTDRRAVDAIIQEIRQVLGEVRAANRRTPAQTGDELAQLRQEVVQIRTGMEKLSAADRQLINQINQLSAGMGQLIMDVRRESILETVD